MYTLFSWQFWSFFVYFAFVVLLAFFFPGDLILPSKKWPVGLRVVTATIVGFVLWGWQGYLFGYLQLRWLTYVYLFITIFSWFRWRFRDFPKLHIQLDWFLLILLFGGILLQLLPIFGNGFRFSPGVYFCCGNQLDNIFHFSLTQSIVNHFPPLEPGLVGVQVKNYHYWFNLIVAELVRVFKLPLLPTLFQYSGFFLSLFYGLSIIILVNVLNLGMRVKRLAIFFSYFATDAIYFLLLAVKNLNGWNGVSSLEDGTTLLINPPRAAAMVVALVGLVLFLLWRRDKKMSLGLISVLVLATTIGLKVYIGIFVGLFLAFFLVKALFLRKWQDIWLACLFYGLSLVIYLPVNSQSGGLFYAPFHFANNFIVQPAFRLERWEMARQIFADHRNWPRVWISETIFTAVTLVTLFGSKLVVFFQPWKSLVRLGRDFAWMFLVTILVNIFIGFMFMQKSGGANTFNFIVSAWLFLSIPSALAVDYWIGKLKQPLAYIFLGIIVLVNLPRIISNTHASISAYHKLDFLFIENDDLAAYSYLRQQTPADSVILVDDLHGIDHESPLVYGFTQRQMFLSGVGILNSHGHETSQLVLSKKLIFRSADPKIVAKELFTGGIDYILLWEGNQLAILPEKIFAEKVFFNPNVTLLKINQDKIEKFLKQKVYVQ